MEVKRVCSENSKYSHNHRDSVQVIQFPRNKHKMQVQTVKMAQWINVFFKCERKLKILIYVILCR